MVFQQLSYAHLSPTHNMVLMICVSMGLGWGAHVSRLLPHACAYTLMPGSQYVASRNSLDSDGIQNYTMT